MNTKSLVTILILALATGAGFAQQQNTTKPLNKEITLEKDFVPVEKKATKKNVLPAVTKVAPPAKTTLQYSDWSQPTTVPSSIPTMMPYGYRTAHHFSDKRGYLDIGGGSQANFAGSFGYRIIDSERSQLGVWVQHNSTWNGRNASPLITDKSLRLKQKFNDNSGGFNFSTETNAGTLDFGARLHYDSFNYYGGTNQAWDDQNKQSFLEYGFKLGWEGNVPQSDLGYHANVGFNHAGYDIKLVNNVDDLPLLNTAKGASENVLNFEVGATYALAGGTLGLDLRGDYVSHRADWQNIVPFFDEWNNVGITTANYRDHHSPFILTISPYYAWENRIFRARVGADLVMGKLHLRDFDVADDTDRPNDKDFHVAPKAQIDLEPISGVAVFADIQGGVTLNTLSSLAAQYRYSDPLGRYFNSFSPFDGDFGVKFGPFKGFSAKLWAGYGIYKSDLQAVVPDYYYILNATQKGYHLSNVAGTSFANIYATTIYRNVNYRGIRFGAQMNYRYRSIAEAQVKFLYSPSNDFTVNGWNRGSMSGLDCPDMKLNLDLKVHPIARLTVEAGLDWRGSRAYVSMNSTDLPTALPVASTYEWVDMEDFINLRAGASYRFDRVLTLWLRADNLLNRKQDITPGMGQQRLSLVGGIGLVF